MARPTQMIRQDMQKLHEVLEQLDESCQSAYQNYLEALGAVVKRQLVLACFQVCTQSYPKRFLSLSLADRTEFQQKLRSIARQAESQVIQAISADSSSRPAPKADIAALLSLLSQSSGADAAAESSEELSEGEDSDPIQQQPIQNEELPPEPVQLESVYLEPEKPELELTGDLQVPEADSLELQLDTEGQPVTEISAADLAEPQSETPGEQISAVKQKLLRYKHLESTIGQCVNQASYAVNQLLQHSRILPKNIPQPVLEIAARAEPLSDTTSDIPNVMKLRIEAEAISEDSEPDRQVIELTTVYLRLSELEFSDAVLSRGRAKIRELLNRMRQLERDHQRLEQEQAIAEAEAAWRTSWFED